jgi:hypothetical protein
MGARARVGLCVGPVGQRSRILCKGGKQRRSGERRTIFRQLLRAAPNDPVFDKGHPGRQPPSARRARLPGKRSGAWAGRAALQGLAESSFVILAGRGPAAHVSLHAGFVSGLTSRAPGSGASGPGRPELAVLSSSMRALGRAPAWALVPA